MTHIPHHERSVQAILFDFDETLATLAQPAADLAVAGANAAAAVLRGAGLDLPDDFEVQWLKALEFAASKSVQEQDEHTADDTLAFLVQFYGYVALDRKLVRQAVDAHFAPFIEASILLPGAHETLTALHADGYYLGIVANHNCDRALQRTVRKLGLHDLVDVTLTSQTVEQRKPKTKLFEVALSYWDVAPYQAVAVGDRLDEDVAPAQDFGLRAALLTLHPPPSNQQAARLVIPDASLTAWDSFLPLLARWQAEDAAGADDFWADRLPAAPPPLTPDFDPTTPA
mgnify:CR=1 FL=1